MMNKETILIIDDELDVLLVLKKALDAEDYSVITAPSGNEGVAIARSKHPDLIILDRALGDMLGEEVAEILRNDPDTKGIPIVYLSALFSKTDEEEKCHCFNGSAMFAKPYNINELVTTIEKLLRESKCYSTK
jgi:DNA-binding response OmpR family regulator